MQLGRAGPGLCPPAQPWCPAHLVALQHVGGALLVGDVQPDVGEGRGIVAQPQAHLHLDQLTGLWWCRGTVNGGQVQVHGCTALLRPATLALLPQPLG